MDYEEFKAKVIEIHETYGNWSHGECRKLIPEIELTAEDKRILAAGPAAAGAAQTHDTDAPGILL